MAYVVYAWAEGSDASRTAFPFDLAAPPAAPVKDDPGTVDYGRVAFADSGLSAEVPLGWMRLGSQWVWTPTEGSGLLLGVRWADLQPPQEAEPVLLPQPAQIVQAEDIDLPWGGGRLLTVEVLGTASPGDDDRAPIRSVEMHAILIASGNGTRRAYDLYATAPDAAQMDSLGLVLRHAIDTAALAIAGEVPAGQEPPADWVLFQDETYGFSLSMPADWTWKEMITQGPGVPDDWPVVRGVQFYPQAWDAEINRQGPPDPTAKPVVAPIQLEVVVGSADQFRRVYPQPTTSEQVEIGGMQVTVEREFSDSMSIARHVFQSPTDPELYVTLTDQLTGFADRVMGNEAVAEVIPLLLDTVMLGP
jgi:hypothetical protein